MQTYDDYNKLKKSEVINLLLEKDRIVNDLQGRLEAVEKKLTNFSITSNVAMRLMEMERASYQQQ